ncbi:MAG: dephospho-CoA kinase, partial [Ruthenibacterium sp.]
MSQNTMIVGLTGQTGAGKSTISRMFADRGVPVIDADVVARETMEHSKSCLMDLVLEFSTEII